MKIVLNKCYGGFGLSTKAFDWLIVNKGWKLDKDFVKATSTYGDKDTKYWAKGDREELRINLDVIECVEVLGKEASNRLSDMRVVEIPDNANWEIDEYDGIESVRESSEVWG